MTLDDVFKLESIPEVTLSGDGRSIAYSRCVKAGGALRTTFLGFCHGNGSMISEVWVTPTSGGAAKRVAVDPESSVFSPMWSPDGSRLAVLSSNGRDGVISLWTWEQASGRLAQLSNRIRWCAAFSIVSWLDDQRLMVCMRPEGSAPRLTVPIGGAQAAAREWDKFLSGTQATASILEAGLPEADVDTRPLTEVSVIDVTGRVHPLISSPGVSLAHRSPDGRYIAAAVNELPVSTAHVKQHSHGYEKRLVVADTSGRAISMPHPLALSWSLALAWSPSGNELAFLAPRDDNPEQAAAYVQRGPVTGPFETIRLQPTLAPTKLMWAGNTVFVMAESRASASGATAPRRNDWWLVPYSGDVRNITTQFTSPPSFLVPTRTQRAVVGVIDGDVWQFDLASGRWTNMTTTLGPKVTELAWPRLQPYQYQSSGISRYDAGFKDIIITTSHDGRSEHVKLNLESGRTTSIACPQGQQSDIMGYDAQSGTAVCLLTNDGVTSLAVAQNGTPREVLEVNAFLRDVEAGSLKQIAYRSLNGEDLKGWVLLPVNYQEGKRYPLVTWVYLSHVQSDDVPSADTAIEQLSDLNLQLFAARGYAVLLPSMPVPYGPVDRYLELMNGVMPAVDKVIDLGIADPKRLAVAGQSYGGYSVAGLVSLTHRFQAAIAISGIYDDISFSGTFMSDSRYTADLVQDNLKASHGRGRVYDTMGSNPWENGERYLMNSPLFHADRIETPLLIVHGDLDHIPMSQAEELFSALYHQGKRARFIRLWGEGHAIWSPHNQREMWKQIYEWLETYLSNDASSAVATTRP